MTERDIVERLKDLIPFSLDGDPRTHAAQVAIDEINRLRAFVRKLEEQEQKRIIEYSFAG